MSASEQEDTTIYQVVVNDEEQYRSGRLTARTRSAGRR